MTATAPGLAQGAIQPAIYQLLAGDALLAALVDARIYDAVPEPTVNNYVAIGEWTEDADDTLEADDAGLGSNATLTIHVYTDDARGSAGYKAGQAIAARVVRLLHRAPLAVQGFDTVTCEHETTDSFRDEDLRASRSGISSRRSGSSPKLCRRR
jgi:hypothetical protein